MLNLLRGCVTVIPVRVTRTPAENWGPAPGRNIFRVRDAGGRHFTRAPFFLMTSLHTLRKSRANFRAFAWASVVRMMLRTLAL